MTWGAFSDLIQRRREGEKDGPNFILATFKPNRTDGFGGSRVTRGAHGYCDWTARRTKTRARSPRRS